MAAASEDDGDRLRSQDLPFGVIPIPKNVVLRVATLNRGSASLRRLPSEDCCLLDSLQHRAGLAETHQGLT
jgi:hypothetical protein